MNPPLRAAIEAFLISAIIMVIGCTDRDTTSGNAAGDSDVDESTENTTEIIDDEAGFHISVSLSPVISTAVIVTWTFNKGTVSGGAVAFGPDAQYGYAAPSDTKDADHKTILLGMKPDSTVHFRIVANAEGRTYRSGDHTVKTGRLAAGLPSKTVSNLQPNALEGGYLVTCSFGGDYAFILDADGDYVWWYNPSGDINDWVRARLTADGKSMLIANGNVPGPDNGTLVKVSMDGMEETVYPLSSRHHDVTVLPDSDVIVYFEYEESGKGRCDRLMEMHPDGSTREVFKVRDHFPQYTTGSEWCHSNAVSYVPREDAYYLSVLDFNAVLKIDRETGELLWVFGGDDSDFPGVSWNAQHQHHVLEDSILIFNNRGSEANSGFNTPSRALEFSLDETKMTASQIWEYDSGTLNSMAMGDVKRMPNGNTLVVFSTSGVLQEVDAEGELLREISFGAGGAVGYIEWREKLYGPPEEYL